MILKQQMHWRIAEDIASLGSTPVSALLLLLLLLFGSFALAWQFALGILITFVLIISLRLLIAQTRPRPRKITGILTYIDAQSFPSAHATRSALAATLLTLAYPSLPVLLIALVLVVLVCIARVLLGEHRVRDVLAGTLLGCVIALVIAAKPL